MTNLLLLPQIPAGTAIAIGSNADFNDQLFVSQPNFLSTPLVIVGTLNGTTTVSGLGSVNGLVSGMPILAPGLLPNTTIVTVGATTLTLNQAATVSVSGTQLTVLPPPLDLTGISFSSMLRPTAISTTVLLNMTTANGFMTNGSLSGKFGWSVPAAKLPAWSASLFSVGQLSLVMDVQATDVSGAIVDLCAENGPIPVTVNLNVTR